MSRIKVKTLILDKCGIELLKDQESFMNELQEEEMKIIQGGDTYVTCSLHGFNTINGISCPLTGNLGVTGNVGPVTLGQ